MVEVGHAPSRMPIHCISSLSSPCGARQVNMLAARHAVKQSRDSARSPPPATAAMTVLGDSGYHARHCKPSDGMSGDCHAVRVLLAWRTNQASLQPTWRTPSSRYSPFMWCCRLTSDSGMSSRPWNVLISLRTGQCSLAPRLLLTTQSDKTTVPRHCSGTIM